MIAGIDGIDLFAMASGEDALLEEVIEVAQRYADRCDRSRIPCTSTWRRDITLEPAQRDAAS